MLIHGPESRLRTVIYSTNVSCSGKTKYVVITDIHLGSFTLTISEEMALEFTIAIELNFQSFAPCMPSLHPRVMW